MDVLAELRGRGIRLAVVSDNWHGLERLYQQLGLRDYFAGFVVSADLGCTKPDPRMYRAGSDRLGLQPAECVFVDDDPALAAAATRLGYHGLTIDRSGSPAAGTITGLDQLLDLVDG